MQPDAPRAAIRRETRASGGGEMLTRLVMIAVLVAGAESVMGQSLAEVAAKEKERRARAGGSAKTFTDSDLQDAALKRARENPSSAGKPAPSPATGSDSPVVPPATQDPSGPTDSSVSEASKRARGAEYKAQLDATNATLKRAEERLRAVEEDWRMVNNHPWALAAAFERVRSRLEAARKDVELLRRERDDIEDAARREGIPPGYYLR